MSAEIHDLFPDTVDERPIARRSDPKTSKVAAATYSKTNRQSHCDLLLEVIAANPGHTAMELSRFLIRKGMKISTAVRMPNRRVNDLRKKNMIYRGRVRTCDETGHQAATWYAAPDFL